MARPERAVTIRLPTELYERIERMARRQHRSVSSMVTYMLDLAEENWDYLATKALAREKDRLEEEQSDEEILEPELVLA